MNILKTIINLFNGTSKSYGYAVMMGATGMPLREVQLLEKGMSIFSSTSIKPLLRIGRKPQIVATKPFIGGKAAKLAEDPEKLQRITQSIAESLHARDLR